MSEGSNGYIVMLLRYKFLLQPRLMDVKRSIKVESGDLMYCKIYYLKNKI